MNKVMCAFLLVGTVVFLVLTSVYGVRRLYRKYPESSWIRSIPIAHRGFFDHKSHIPENSLLAFSKAIEAGYAIELDVRLTKDGHVMVFHDQNVKRMTGVDRDIHTLSALEVSSYALLETQQRIPTLQQVLDLVAGQVPLYIELKIEGDQNLGELEQAVAHLLTCYQQTYFSRSEEKSGEYQTQQTDVIPQENNFAVISFHPKTILWFKDNYPDFYRGQSYDPDELSDTNFVDQIIRVLSWCFMSQPSFLIYDHETLNDGAQWIVSKFMPLISYNIYTEPQAYHAKRYASNIIFEGFSPSL